MTTCIKDIITHLEQVAPLAYQEAYDNAGLVVGDADAVVQGVLTCLDVTEAVLEEARQRGCNLIVAHHPLIFRPIKHLTGGGAVERCLLYAIRHGLAIYTIHTNLDNVAQGVNQQLACAIGLQDTAILQPKPDTWSQLVTFVPPSAAEGVLRALHQAGAGCIGAYAECSFVSRGTGSFRPAAGAQPHTGRADVLTHTDEERIEVVFPTHLHGTLIRALREAHPYEEVAYSVHRLANADPHIGAGMIGTLPEALSGSTFLAHLKQALHLQCVRHTAPLPGPIRRVAICGGAGSSLIPCALARQADALVTADVKYHDFFKAAGRLLLADVGHYESEVGTKALLHALVSEKFANIATFQCQTVTNPIHYC